MFPQLAHGHRVELAAALLVLGCCPQVGSRHSWAHEPCFHPVLTVDCPVAGLQSVPEGFRKVLVWRPWARSLCTPTTGPLETF